MKNKKFLITMAAFLLLSPSLTMAWDDRIAGRAHKEDIGLVGFTGPLSAAELDYYDYTLSAMAASKTTLRTDEIKHDVAKKVAIVAASTFSSPALARAWIAFIGAQSQFDALGRSKKKKKGIGRLDARYLGPLNKLCTNTRTAKSVKNVIDGASLSACYFLRLYEATGSLVSVYAFYREGRGAKALIEKNITTYERRSLDDVFDQESLAEKLFDDSMTEVDQKIMSLQLQVSSESISRKLISAFVERDVSELFGFSTEQRLGFSRARAYLNGLNAFKVDKRIPRAIRSKTSGLGALGKAVRREASFGCGSEQLDSKSRGDRYRSMMASACIYSKILDQQGDVNLAASRFILIQRGVIAPDDMSNSNPTRLNLNDARRHQVEKINRLIDLNLTAKTSAPGREFSRTDRLGVNILAASLAGSTIFNSAENRLEWYIVLRIENNFRHARKSSAGAVGIGQLLPQYASDFGRSCGIFSMNQTDVSDLITNALLSACYYGEQKQKEGFTNFALVAYNAGPYSDTLDRSKRMLTINHETANYVSLFSIAKELFRARSTNRP